MGVAGLLRLLQPTSVPRNLLHFRGQTLGVDGYAWLHRAAASCAEELLRGTPTAKLVQSIDNRIRLYESAGIQLYFVFDGADLHMKQRVEDQRRRARETARAEYATRTESKVGLRGVNILPDHAAMIVSYLQVRGIRFVVAPYEADAQLVYLEKLGLIDGVLSEDSDLIVFGAQRLLTKSDSRSGECIEVSAAGLPDHLQDPRGLRALAIISGCDYSAGVPGMGPVKTSQLVKAHGGDLEAILDSLARSKRIDAKFIEEARLADLAFQFQRVWDPKKCRLDHLNNPADCAELVLSRLTDTVVGPLLSRPDAHRIARCIVDPNNVDRILKVPPVVSLYVKNLGPFTPARQTRFASPLKVASLVDNRLNRTPSSTAKTVVRSQSSPFFRPQLQQRSSLPPHRDQKSAIGSKPTLDPYANKENTFLLTPLSANSLPEKRPASQHDNWGSSPITAKPRRTDTLTDSDISDDLGLASPVSSSSSTSTAPATPLKTSSTRTLADLHSRFAYRQREPTI